MEHHSHNSTQFWCTTILQDHSGPPRLARLPKAWPCLNFGLQYALIRNTGQKNGVEYWDLPGSNSPWRLCHYCYAAEKRRLYWFFSCTIPTNCFLHRWKVAWYLDEYVPTILLYKSVSMMRFNSGVCICRRKSHCCRMKRTISWAPN